MDKLHHHVAGTFRVLSVNNRTAAIQRVEVVDRVSIDRLTLAPKHLSTTDTTPYRTTGRDVHAKNKTGSAWVFTRIVAHREKSDGRLEINIEWEGNYAQSWETRANVIEEAVSRHLLRIRQQPL